MPNNRQWALLLWLSIAAVWIVAKPDLRRSLGGVLTIALGGRLRYLLLGMAAWVAGELWVGQRLDIWNGSLVTDTIIWYATAGLILFGKFTDVSKQQDFFKHRFRAAIALPVVLEAYTEIGVMPLWAEVPLQPIAFLVGGMQAFVQSDLATSQFKTEEQRRQASRMFGCLVGAISLVILAAATSSVALGWDELDQAQLVRQLTLPVWLTVGLVPYVYLTGVYSAYEQAFLRMRISEPRPNRWSRFRNGAMLVAHCHLRATRVGRFTSDRPSTYGLGTAQIYGEARTVLREFRKRANDP